MTEKPNLRRGYSFIALAIVLFSTVEVISKYLQEGLAGAPVGKIEIALFRFAFGFATVAAVAGWTGESRRAAQALRQNPGAMLLLGVAGIFLTFLCLHWSLDFTDAAMTAVVFSLNPIFTAGLAVAVLKERSYKALWFGLLLGLVGACVAITRLDFARLADRADVRGGLLALAAASSWSLYTVLGKKYTRRHGPIAVSSVSMGIGFLLFALAALGEGSLGKAASYSVRTWLLLAYLGVGSVGVGYLLYFEGLRWVQASRGTALFYMKPLLATIFAFVLLREPLSAPLVLAVALSACGILITTSRRLQPWVED
ncbi:MAG: DMT family transporter [Candidatus Geothermincolia bacterium]